MKEKTKNIIVLITVVLIFSAVISYQVFRAEKMRFQKTEKKQVIEGIRHYIDLLDEGATKDIFDASSKKCFTKAKNLYNTILVDTCEKTPNKPHCNFTELDTDTLEVLKSRVGDILDLCVNFQADI